jgi:hypothetical protein
VKPKAGERIRHLHTFDHLHLVLFQITGACTLLPYPFHAPSNSFRLHHSSSSNSFCLDLATCSRPPPRPSLGRSFLITWSTFPDAGDLFGSAYHVRDRVSKSSVPCSFESLSMRGRPFYSHAANPGRQTVLAVIEL